MTRTINKKKKTEWINGLARIYSEQGYKIQGKRHFFDEEHSTTNEILFKICQVTGLARRTVVAYLASNYKQMSQSRTEPRPESRKPASERIEHELGEEYVERHRKEVLETLRRE